MKFNKDKPFGECFGGAKYFQNGHYFNYHGNEVDESGLCVACADGECLGCSKKAEPCGSCFDDDCKGCNTIKEVKEKSFKDMSWDELRSATKKAGGTAATRKACIAFLESI